MILDIGAGPSSKADVQIDKVRFPNTSIVQDAMMEQWDVPDESFEEVRMEQFLEHCPVSVHFKENVIDERGYPTWKWAIHYPRIHVMKEAYRVLKHGGILHISIPGTEEAFLQDPTHEAPRPTEGQLNYCCGEWGGNTPGSFVYESYGINFQFKKIASFMTGNILTLRYKKE